MSATFNIENWLISENRHSIEFNFSCSKYGKFSEVVTFPTRIAENVSANFESLLDVTAFIVGISYYKCAAAPKLVSSFKIRKSGYELINAVYNEGLGEFFARNKLPYPNCLELDVEIESGSSAESKRFPSTDETQPIVAFGGGKDSHAAIELIERTGRKPQLVSVALSDTVETTLQSMALENVRFIRREIDPNLLHLNNQGIVLNGHIPITAINSALLCLLAMIEGKNWVVFANERGASQPTTTYLDQEVNHQYSKSLGYENLFRNVLSDMTDNTLEYFSILRPFSELWIAAFIAREAGDRGRILASCNRNFVFSGSAVLETGQRWCGRCSKCIYTAIIMAPNMKVSQFCDMFGENLLDDTKNIGFARDLCGLGTAKPWECVGDLQDTLAAMHYLGYDPEWKDFAVVRQLCGEIDSIQTYKKSENHFISELTSRSTNFLPSLIAEIARVPVN
jgi:hypothetical protein